MRFAQPSRPQFKPVRTFAGDCIVGQKLIPHPSLLGYRHIDTALAYGNEKEVGEGIKDSGVAREELWITTKLDNPWHKRVEEGINSSLKSLGVDYVDLYLMVNASV